MRDGVGEHEGAIIVVVVAVVIFVVGGAEVDARATLQGSKEGRGHVGTDPVGYSVQFVTRHEATHVVVVAVADVVAAVHFHFSVISYRMLGCGLEFAVAKGGKKQRTREREGLGVGTWKELCLWREWRDKGRNNSMWPFSSLFVSTVDASDTVSLICLLKLRNANYYTLIYYSLRSKSLLV